jgi:mycothiol system anti-sigma-R factor
MDSHRGWHPHSDCLDAMHRLYDFLDGELDDGRRASIQRHLDECVPCLEAFGFEAELRTVIASKCREQVPEGLRIRVQQVIQQEFGTEDPGWMGGGDFPRA